MTRAPCGKTVRDETVQFVKTDHAAFSGLRPTGCGDLISCLLRPLHVLHVPHVRQLPRVQHLHVRRLPRARHPHVSGRLGYPTFGGFVFSKAPGFFCFRFMSLWAMPWRSTTRAGYLTRASGACCRGLRLRRGLMLRWLSAKPHCQAFLRSSYRIGMCTPIRSRFCPRAVCRLQLRGSWKS